jgi:hypothetical protein
VQSGHSGLASGVNNAIARVANLLAIAAMGAVVAASFQARLDHDLAGRRLSPSARAAAARARIRPLVIDVRGVPAAEKGTVRSALRDASVAGFRAGIEIAALLAVLGGVVSLIGIENPPRRREPSPADHADDRPIAAGAGAEAPPPPAGAGAAAPPPPAGVGTRSRRKR